MDDFRNVLVHDCRIESPTNRGISLQLRDSGNIEDVLFENIFISTTLKRKPYWWGDAEPMAVTAVRRSAGTAVGRIRHVIFRNIVCEGENGVFLFGEEDENGNSNIDDLLFENVRVLLKKQGTEPWETYDLRPTEGEGILAEKHHGLLARHTGRVEFRNCRFEVHESAAEPAGTMISRKNADVTFT